MGVIIFAIISILVIPIIAGLIAIARAGSHQDDNL